MSAPGNTASRKRPNVVVILSDELNPTYLSCYGGEVPTPNLDRLADQGVRFDQAHCVAPACTPSRFSLLTGRYPGRCTHPAFLESNPIDERYGVRWDAWITDRTPTLPRMLSSADYFTGHVGYTDRPDSYDIPRFPRDADPTDPAIDADLRRHQAIYQQRIAKTAGFDATHSVLGENPGYIRVNALNTHNFEWYADGVNAFLGQAEQRDQPFFLYLAPTALHGPNHASDIDRDPRLTHAGRMDPLPPDYPDRASLRQRLEAQGRGVTFETAGLMQLDDHVGYVMDRLERMGVADDTIVVFAADHGLEPGKATCYESGLRVPMIVRWPRGVKAGQTCERPASHVDLLPTLLEAVGVEAPQTALDGRSFLGDITDSVPTTDAGPIYAEMGYFRAIKVGRHKYIAWRYTADQIRRMKDGEVDVAIDAIGRPRQGHSQIAMRYYPHYFDADQLYDIEADPHEQHNLIDDPAHRSTLERLRPLLVERLATFRHPYPLEPQPFRDTPRYHELVEARRKQRTPGWWDDSFEFPASPV
jgi:arylsulfatase A-like enzyme